MKLKNIILGSALVLLAPFLLVSCGHGHCRKDMEEHMLRHLDSHVKDLKLDAAQQKKYEEVRAKVASEMKAMHKQRKDTMKIMDDELKKDSPDMEKAVKSMQEKMKTRQDNMSVFGDHFLEFYAVLNPEQKKELIEDIRKKAKHMHCDD
jgi:Spy/CpxP family protein refolding chaperone